MHVGKKRRLKIPMCIEMIWISKWHGCILP